MFPICKFALRSEVDRYKNQPRRTSAPSMNVTCYKNL